MGAAFAAALELLGPTIINMLRMMLFVHAGKIVVGILGFIGLNFVADHYVIDPMLDQIRAMMATGPTGTWGALMIQYMGILRFDQAVSMMLSAWVMVQTIKNGKILLSKVA
jgi:hypothetical protein